MAVCIIGSSNVYYSLGIHGPFRSFVVIYEMVVLHIFDINILENIYGTDMHVQEDGTILQTPAARTAYYNILCVMMVVISFVMGIALMNLFIAVLTVSYSKATMNSFLIFSRRQASKVLETQSTLAGWNVLRNVCRTKRQQVQRGSALVEQGSWLSGDSNSGSQGEEFSGLFKQASTFSQAWTGEPSGRRNMSGKTFANEDCDLFLWCCLAAIEEDRVPDSTK